MNENLTDMDLGFLFGMITVLTALFLIFVIYYICIIIQTKREKKRTFNTSYNNLTNTTYKNKIRIEKLETSLEIIKIQLDNLKANIINYPK